MIWYVALGGALGSVARYLITNLLQNGRTGAIPVGTLLINVTGSFLLGLLLRLGFESPALSAETRAFLAVGFCGGFTTFSAFSHETVHLMAQGEFRRAGAYVAASVLLSLAAVALGAFAAQRALGFAG